MHVRNTMEQKISLEQMVALIDNDIKLELQDVPRNREETARPAIQ